MTPIVYLIFYKLIFFKTLNIFLEPTIKLITRILDLQKVIVILIMMAQLLFFDDFSEKDLHLNADEKQIFEQKLAHQI